MFLFRLARELGIPDVRELLDMDGAVWEGWQAYSRTEPFGPVRDDLRAAEIACMIAAAGGVRVAPGDVFATLAPPKSHSPARARPHGLSETMAALAARCPALTAIGAD